MSPEQQVQIASIVGLLVVAALIRFCTPIGVLNAASRIVILGAVATVGEHPPFNLAYAAGACYPEASRPVIIPHARIHFFCGCRSVAYG
jgi:hypothetical protein